ncbi:MAG: hypothetical protein K2G55_05225 [Lachnospiraceae bacterium]|nr:hypothetical protein [Lachnospiraceae bacterium]MDE7201918.1 hypothetical protein [Lachnospiraceae bacterium]
MDIEYTANGNLSMTATEQDSVINSVSTIASTPYATAPYIRSLGIRNYPPESNSEIARNQYATEVIAQCSMWEDRVEVSEVRFGKNNDVRMVIKGG